MPILFQILSGLILIILTIIIHNFVDKYWLKRPKIYIHFKIGSFGSTHGSGTKLQMFWNIILVLKNNTKYDAINLEIDFLENPFLSDIKLEKNNHLRAFEKIELKKESYKTN